MTERAFVSNVRLFDNSHCVVRRSRFLRDRFVSRQTASRFERAARNRLFASALFLVLALVFDVGAAQEIPTFETGESGRFSFADFAVNAGFADQEESAARIKAETAIAPIPDGTANLAGFGDKPLVGFLSVQITVKEGWHIYSATQGVGGLPTKLTNVEYSGIPKETRLTVGDLQLASAVKIERDVDGHKLEEVVGTSRWIAPIYSEKGATTASLDSAIIEGQIDALACSDGAGGACVPQAIPFSATYARLDVARDLEALAVARETPDEENARVPSANGGTSDSVEVAPQSFGRVAALLLTAFLGGLILNVTPCVLPVVGLKILSFFEQANRSRASAFLLNVWYAVGVLVVFAALAFASVGLSFLFTRALFQIIMSAIVFVMALSLMGVWELQAPTILGGERSTRLAGKEGPVGAVFKGVITTLLAIPCGAPLLSPALDWASEMTRLGQIELVVLAYLAIGLGLASPFLVAGAFPELLRFFPKPGEWMETFRKTMGYFLLVAVVWILYSAPLEYFIPSLAFLFALWFACWNIGRFQFEADNRKKKTRAWIVSVVVALLVVCCSFNFPGNPIKTTLQSASVEKARRWAIRAERAGLLEQKHWSLFDRKTLDAALADGRPVVVDFTADWCMNCKFLEKTILHTEEIEKLLDEKNILSLAADWTNQDAKTPDVVAINELLDANGARQVPTLMIFRPEKPNQPIVLRGLYAKSDLLEALAEIK